MRLTVLSHKPCWPSVGSPTGYATDGGFPFQMQALSELFDETTLVVPVRAAVATNGSMPIVGHNLTLIPLTERFGRGFGSKLSFGPWLLRNARQIAREVSSADAIHAPIPGDVGTVGMLLGWSLRKPLFVRHCGNWLCPVTAAERLWRWSMEMAAGGRNVMLATGGAADPASRRNPDVGWIFSSSLTQEELRAAAVPRRHPSGGAVRLVIAARQEWAKGAGTVIQALPALAREFPQITFAVLGHGSAVPDYQRLAAALNVADRVTFTGQLTHDQVLAHLKQAAVFVFPTTSSDGFPKAVLEALAVGLPVVATRVSVLPQLLGSGCGVLINEATPEAVVQGVCCALRSATTYEAMSRQAITAASAYSLEAWRDAIGARLTQAWGPLKRPVGSEAMGREAVGHDL